MLQLPYAGQNTNNIGPAGIGGVNNTTPRVPLPGMFPPGMMPPGAMMPPQPGMAMPPPAMGLMRGGLPPATAPTQQWGMLRPGMVNNQGQTDSIQGLGNTSTNGAMGFAALQAARKKGKMRKPPPVLV